MEQPKLPYRVLQCATDIFAGSTGFSIRQMDDFFCNRLNKHLEEIGLDFSDCTSRTERFRLWLSLFSADQQRAIIWQLCNGEGGQFYHGEPDFERCQNLITLLGSTALDEIMTDGLACLGSTHVAEVWRKALYRRMDDPEGAITAARQLVESICKHILDDSGVQYAENLALPKLYRQTAAQLNLAPEQHNEQIFKQILGGCQSVIEGLAGLRNELGDAHGKGRKDYRPASRHAELAVNLAGSISLFLVETWERNRTAR